MNIIIYKSGYESRLKKLLDGFVVDFLMVLWILNDVKLGIIGLNKLGIVFGKYVVFVLFGLFKVWFLKFEKFIDELGVLIWSICFLNILKLLDKWGFWVIVLKRFGIEVLEVIFLFKFMKFGMLFWEFLFLIMFVWWVDSWFLRNVKVLELFWVELLLRLKRFGVNCVSFGFMVMEVLLVFIGVFKELKLVSFVEVVEIVRRFIIDCFDLDILEGFLKLRRVLLLGDVDLVVELVVLELKFSKLIIGWVGGRGFDLESMVWELFGGGGGGGNLNLLDEDVVGVKLFIFILFIVCWGLFVVDGFFLDFLLGILISGFCILVLGMLEVEVWRGFDGFFLLNKLFLLVNEDELFNFGFIFGFRFCKINNEFVFLNKLSFFKVEREMKYELWILEERERLV